MQTLWQDLRFGARMLLKKPGFTTIAVIMLALGIGANTAIFSLVNALFLRPLPVKDAHQLVGIYEVHEGRLSSEDLSYPDYLDYRDRNTVFSGLAAHCGVWVWLTEGEVATKLYGNLVSANFFSVLGVQPRLGRFFLSEEDAAPGARPVVVLSHRVWQQRFGGDPAIVGRTLRMNRLAFTVVGIAPEGINGVHAGGAVDVWMPTMMATMGRPPRDEFSRSHTWLDLVGRLKPGRTLAEAQAEFATLAGQLKLAFPGRRRGNDVSLAPLRGIHPRAREDAAKAPTLLTKAVACMLLIACINLAGLLLARGATRRKEIAIRLALGAGRARLVRQLVTESLILSALGGAVGLLIAVWAGDFIATFYAYGFEGLNLSLDWLTFGYTCALSVGSGLLFGLVPALQATRADLVTTLKDDGTTIGYRRSLLRSSLVVAQVALALVLLVGAGLLLRSVSNVLSRPGFDPNHIAHLRLRPGRLGYDTEKAQAFHREALRRVEALPGVQSAALLAWGIPTNAAGSAPVALPGQAPARPEDAFRVGAHEITPRYLATLKIPLLNGREFTEGDRKGAPLVAIVNEALARRLWPSRDPVGQSLIVGGKEHQIVGLATDALPHSSDQPPLPLIYLAYWQRELTDSRLLARVLGDPDTMLPLLRREVMAIDPDVHIGQEMSLVERNRMTFQTERLLGVTLVCAGVIALFLSAIGLYGLLAFAVGQRTREIGVRMALGARHTDVLRLVVGQGLKLVVCGGVFGLVAAFALRRALSGFLYGVNAGDPITFICVALTLMAVALVACWIPARRATKVDPMVALRTE